MVACLASVLPDRANAHRKKQTYCSYVALSGIRPLDSCNQPLDAVIRFPLDLLVSINGTPHFPGSVCDGSLSASAARTIWSPRGLVPRPMARGSDRIGLGLH